ncbi:glycerophosphoryl diester phosphodiesterase membrane domain-containing protein, partial [Arthrobacter sp. H14]|uniref:glycerophosphoryl diester phosphodiesterase membrane domain-containing protein n=1 Tax=Arthrobacter sp. H14 TaxID=1312959 RepID=UPI00056A7A42
MRRPPAFVHFDSSVAKSRGRHSKRKGTTPFPILGVSAAALRHTRAGLVGLTLAVLFGQGLTLLVAIPLISTIFELVLEVSGLSRITDRNLLQVLSDPWAATLLLALILIAFIAITVQLAAIVVVANRLQSARVLSFPGAMKDLAGALRAMLNVQSPLLMVYVFAIMPLGGFGLLSAITRDIGIPAFISGEMMKAPASFLLYGALIAAAFYINLRLVFVFPILSIERTTPWQAIRRSITATHRRSWRILVLVGMIWAAAAVGTAVLVETVTLAAGLAGQV